MMASRRELETVMSKEELDGVVSYVGLNQTAIAQESRQLLNKDGKVVFLKYFNLYDYLELREKRLKSFKHSKQREAIAKKQVRTVRAYLESMA